MLFLHRLPEAITFAGHLKDFAVVRKSIQQGCRHPFALEDLLPLAEWQIACDECARAFVTIRKDLEQQLGAASTEAEVSQLVADQQVGFV